MGQNQRERGHSKKKKKKSLGWEVYECNGPVATSSIFFDMMAEALRLENTDVIVIAGLTSVRGKINVPFSNLIS